MKFNIEEVKKLKMNELNIYTKFKYRKIIKSANVFFGKKYIWYNPKTVFTSKYDNFTISFSKRNVRICYWNENTESGKRAIELLIDFINGNFANSTIGITTCNNTDAILNRISKSIKIIKIQ